VWYVSRGQLDAALTERHAAHATHARLSHAVHELTERLTRERALRHEAARRAAAAEGAAESLRQRVAALQADAARTGAWKVDVERRVARFLGALAEPA
jgi:hypothetical protein